MNIVLRTSGSLSRYFGLESTVELQDASSLQDLLLFIEHRWGALIPEHLWNFKKHRFRGGVVIMINDKAEPDRNAKLRDADVVTLFKAVVGG